MSGPNAPVQGRTPALNPAALAVEDAARVLSRVGGEAVTADMLNDDIEDGAPTNPDGTINLVHYAAWLVQQMSAGAHRAD